MVDVANVVWCTGFRTDFGWIDLPVFDDEGGPRSRTAASSSPSPACRSSASCSSTPLSSDVLPGRGRDAKYVAKHIVAKQRKVFCEFGADEGPGGGLAAYCS